MRSKITAIVLLLAALIAGPTYGWGPDGHRIIGDIATGYLTAPTKAAIKELLGDQSLADVSNWADEIRRDASFDWAKALHYINVPHDATRVDLKRDCAEDRCVVGAINKYAAVLRDENASRDDRIIALKFLIHFVGDVHQPLHVSFADDRGGNSVKVEWLGQRDWNLHRVWDNGLIEHRMSDQHMNRDAMTGAILKSITDRKLKQWRQSLNPVDWANESLAITNRIYKQLPNDGRLDDKYYVRQIGTVDERLATAGVRLAALLNDIFDQPAKSKPAAPNSN